MKWTFTSIRDFTLSTPTSTTLLADNSAQQLAKIAKTYRETKGVEEIAGIQAVLTALKAKMVAAANTGGIYVQITPESDPTIYAAATTKSGIKWLQDPAQGFTVELSNRVCVIYWDRRDRIEREAAGLVDVIIGPNGLPITTP